MMRIEPNAVLKYFDPLDAFVKIRRFTDVEVGRLLSDVRVSTKRSYMDLVLNASVIGYAEGVLPRISTLDLPERMAVEERLYDLCVQVSPALDIRLIMIPVAEGAPAEIHLLERKAPAPERSFRHLKDMEDELSRRVIGQPEAIHSVSRAVKKAMTGLRDPERPIGTFFFVGQTGVGKTELAKALTGYLFHDIAKMVRVDCSEFALPHEVAKLVGSPPGYIGHEQGGFLAEALASREQAVVLFDEIEKSDVKIHDLLLQIMDEGFFTDNKGRRVSLRNAIVILTSNVGAPEIEEIRRRVGFDAGRRTIDRDTVLQETLATVNRRFKPEFVNRLNEIVLFKPIGLAECVKITCIMLEDVKRHAASVPLELHIDSDVAPHLAERGFKPEFGARELRRTVEREVEGRLSDLLIEGKVREGDTVDIRVSRDRIIFHRN